MYHEPVLLKESIEGLNINPDGVYVDATYGGGGHSAEILSKLSSKGRLIAFDQDKDAHKNKLHDTRLSLIYGNFRYIQNYLEYLGYSSVNGILADLGISSHQIDEYTRGFSYRLGGKLDMRMNDKQKLSASDILNNYDEKNLYFIFNKYCEITNTKKLVNLILEYRIYNKIETIEEFIDLISPITPKNKEYKYLSQVFQAIRISVNDEINALKDFLNSCSKITKIGSRLSIISYHSLEDRLVKNLIKTGNTEGKIETDIFGVSNLNFKAINKKIILPSTEEIEKNSRAKSAKLRIAEKI
ncbi:MAG: 16S rRNA (cytosine(1402)-N(4))-methyltransferase RsmH [Bacteroidales bacterium]|nr:16S rRNA (cytosine(1402)-N(4))-methyltransferase RsmH [Bacteroidales bacterium]MDY0314390.1 16S rRNA (cytosine(1402)-N(4))-methyltransferase RsmH [Bacteroidales bacterium]